MNIMDYKYDFFKRDFRRNKLENFNNNYKKIKNDLIKQNRDLKNISQEWKLKKNKSLSNSKFNNFNKYNNFTSKHSNFNNNYLNTNQLSNKKLNSEIYNSLFIKNNKKDNLLLKQEIIKLSFKNKKLKLEVKKRDNKIKELTDLLKKFKIPH